VPSVESKAIPRVQIPVSQCRIFSAASNVYHQPSEVNVNRASEPSRVLALWTPRKIQWTGPPICATVRRMPPSVDHSLREIGLLTRALSPYGERIVRRKAIVVRKSDVSIRQPTDVRLPDGPRALLWCVSSTAKTFATPDCNYDDH
jgi:hypothetical protein